MPVRRMVPPPTTVISVVPAPRYDGYVGSEGAGGDAESDEADPVLTASGVRSKPAMVSLPNPAEGYRNMSLPLPPFMVSLLAPPSMVSVPIPPLRVSVPARPMMVSSPAEPVSASLPPPPSIDNPDQGDIGEVQHVVAGRAEDVDPGVTVRVDDFHRRDGSQPDDGVGGQCEDGVDSAPPVTASKPSP